MWLWSNGVALLIKLRHVMGRNFGNLWCSVVVVLLLYNLKCFSIKFAESERFPLILLVVTDAIDCLDDIVIRVPEEEHPR